MNKIFNKKFARVFIYIVLFGIFSFSFYQIVYAIINQVLVTDSFTDTTKIASNASLSVDTTNGQVYLLADGSWSCGDALVDSRDAKTYTTVLIGSQCWMSQNLNVGTLVTGVTTQTDNSVIEKYCYSDSEANCTTYGGLYQWNEMMNYVTTAGVVGICPAGGWHIPTHDEFTLLELTTCTSGSCATDFPYDTTTTGWRGTNEGTTLKSGAGLFKGLLAGGRGTGGSFLNLGTNASFWSSVESAGSAWNRTLYSGNATVYRNPYDKAYGFSVRCLKD